MLALLFPQIWAPSPGNRDLRQLLWHRHRLVQMRTRVSHPSHSHLSPQAVRLVVSRLRGRAVQTSAPMTRKELGRFCFCTEFSTCEVSGGVDAKWLRSLSLLDGM